MQTLSDIWQGLSPEGKRALAVRCGTSMDYLYQLSVGYRHASPRMARIVHGATGVPIRSLVRPELAELMS